jgi:hypothetical protein
MSLGTEPSRENLTLSEADLAACKPLAGAGGHVLRARCPFHGSDHQRSLRVTLASGRFVCFACGAWGYLAAARERWQAEQQRQQAPWRPPARPQPVQRQRSPAAVTAKSSTPRSPVPRGPTPARPDLPQQLAAFQAALPGSRGEAYLRQRGMPLALAQQYGVGYAAPGTWPHKARDWKRGRVVFPHTTPEGRVVNLYGRAVGTREEVPKAKRHDHLPGEKGYFNAAALREDAGPLWVCEGAFDALALLAAGVPRVVAIFGVHGWRWDWMRQVRALVFALDADAAGQQQWRALARQAALRGKRVAVLPPEAYGGCKDVSEAGAAGVLRISGWPAAEADGAEGIAGPEKLQEAWAERVAIIEADGHVSPAEAERLAGACLVPHDAGAGRAGGRPGT